MTVAPDGATALQLLQATLRAVHSGRIRDLRVEKHASGVEVSGEAVSYYAIQLVIRDVLATGVRHCRTRIRARRPVAPPTALENG